MATESKDPSRTCMDRDGDPSAIVTAMFVAAENWRAQVQFHAEFEFLQRSAETLDDALALRFPDQDPDKTRQFAYADGFVIKSLDGYRCGFFIRGASDFDPNTGNSTWSSREVGYYKDREYWYSPAQMESEQPEFQRLGTAAFFPRRSQFTYGSLTMNTDPIGVTLLEAYPLLEGIRRGAPFAPGVTAAVDFPAADRLALVINEAKEPNEHHSWRFVWLTSSDLPTLCEASYDHYKNDQVVAQWRLIASEFEEVSGGVVPRKILRAMGPLQAVGSGETSYVVRCWQAKTLTGALPEDAFQVMIPDGVVFSRHGIDSRGRGPAIVDLTQPEPMFGDDQGTQTIIEGAGKSEDKREATRDE